MSDFTIDDRNATVRHYILGHLIDICGRLMTPDLIDSTCKKILDDVLSVIDGK
jgi:hypothetical protein